VPGAQTVRAALLASPVDPGVLEPQFRRLARPLGPIGRRQGRPGTPSSGLLRRLNDGSLRIADPPPIPTGLSRFDRAGLTPQHLRADKVLAASGTTGYVPREVLPGGPPPAPPPVRPVEAGHGDEPLRHAIADLFDSLTQPPASPPKQTPVDLDDLTGRVVAALDPAVTISKPTGDRVHLNPDQIRDPGVDELEPVLAAPHFPLPMSAPLCDLSQDWLLPGLDQVPPNSVSLAVTNERFVEAYMVGLNVELGRELLWNLYPAGDQRGTYFDRFWETSGSVLAGGATPAPDIDPVAEWPNAGPLGVNAPGGGPADAGRIVLILRGDLMRRYPTAILYAVRAKAGPVFDLQGEERHPVFSGTLEPDVSFFGFDLSADQAAGRDGGPGWYLVFVEQPSETRFGLDDADTAGPMSTWQDLTWAHLGSGVTYIDVGHAVTPPAHPGGAGWGTHAADMAVITSQQPVRVAIHAARLLPDYGAPP
jgi:hypothetical protein